MLVEAGGWKDIAHVYTGDVLRHDVRESYVATARI